MPIPLNISTSCLEVLATVDYNQGGITVNLSPDQENVIDFGHVSKESNKVICEYDFYFLLLDLLKKKTCFQI